MAAQFQTLRTAKATAIAMSAKRPERTYVLLGVHMGYRVESQEQPTKNAIAHFQAGQPVWVDRRFPL